MNDSEENKMDVSRVMARFLPLMDLSILLLGMFLIVLSIAKFNEFKSLSPVLTAEVTEESVTPPDLKKAILKETLNTMEFLPIYGCCNSANGRVAGHCYLLDPNLMPGKEIRMDAADDLQKIIKDSGFNEENLPIICLVTGKGAWDAHWDANTIQNLESTWRCGKIYRLINFENLPFED